MAEKQGKIKVCIIRSNPVKPDSRVEKEAWTLKKAGYDVHILAWDRDSNQKTTDDFIYVADEKIPIVRLGYPATYGEGFKNLKSYLSFQFHMRKWLRENCFHVIHACDFDTAFFSYGVAKSKNIKFVFDIFDFICAQPENFFENCVKRAQYRLINKADATIICTEERRKQISGSKPQKMCVIHNTPFSEQLGDELFELKETKKIKIAYVGILQDYRLLKEVAEVVSESENFELHIGGFGKYHDYFVDMSAKHTNIIYYGRLSYNQTLALEKSCDILLAIYEPNISNHRYAAPNKFYESLMLGKPVVMVQGTGMSQIVAENNIGVLIEYSKEGFRDGLNKLFSCQSEWKAMGEKMQEIYQQQYSWSIMEQRLSELYKEMFNM